MLILQLSLCCSRGCGCCTGGGSNRGAVVGAAGGHQDPAPHGAGGGAGLAGTLGGAGGLGIDCQAAQTSEIEKMTLITFD